MPDILPSRIKPGYDLLMGHAGQSRHTVHLSGDIMCGAGILPENSTRSKLPHWRTVRFRNCLSATILPNIGNRMVMTDNPAPPLLVNGPKN